MPLAFAGYVQAKWTVPSSTTISVSSGALTSPVTVTLPADAYYHTAAGGVDSGIDELESQLNDNVQGYPQSAAAMKVACGGYGTWSAGWLFNISSGNDSGAFGGVTMTAVSSPTYGHAGPKGGIDLMVGSDSVADGFSAGDVLDVSETDDLVGAFVLYAPSLSGNEDIGGRDNGTTGYLLVRELDKIALYVRDGAETIRVEASITANINWICLYALERATNQVRIATIPFYGGAVSISAASSTAAVGSLANATSYLVGDNGTYRAGGIRIGAHYAGEGSGAATGMVANLQTAIETLQAALNSGWTVSLETTNGTGLVTVVNSFWPSSVSFTSTTLRDVAGYEYNFDWPSTAAQMTAAVGGIWTSGVGFLLNESSGNVASAFGSPATGTATGITYSNWGFRGGTDKAIGFDTNTDNVDLGDVFDVTATDDIIIAWGALWSSAGTFDFIQKYPGGTPYWELACVSGAYRFGADSGSGLVSSSTSAFGLNTPHVGLAVIDRGAGTIRVAVKDLITGAVSVGAATALAANTLANAASTRIGTYSGGGGAPTPATISAIYITVGPGVASGLSASMSTAIANWATYMTSQTGTQQARGIWFPDSPFNADDHPSMVPLETDARSSESPTGVLLTLTGNEKYAHKNVLYERSPVDRIRERSATYANASLEVFYRDVVVGLGDITWFTPGSDLQFWWANAGSIELVGSDGVDADGSGVSGWRPAAIPKFGELARPSQKNWVGQFDVRFPRIVSSG